MYVTKRLSMYKKFPSELSSQPPEGPNSGILVIEDEEAESTCCFGLCKTHQVTELPLPQNKGTKLQYRKQVGETSYNTYFSASLIPVLNQPLSSNRYYAIQTQGRHTGEAYVSSREEDKGSCLCFSYVSDVPPKPLDPNDVYQQFDIYPGGGLCISGFVAKSASRNGFPPTFMGRSGWRVKTSTRRDFHLGDASGLDTALRARLPDFNFPLSYESSQPVVVGRWYSPFMFIREGTLKDQVSRSMYYEITLEQRWEREFACDRSDSQGNAVVVDAVVKRELVSVAGMEAVDVNVVDGVTCFKSFSNEGGEGVVGLRLEVIERMKWEQERVGWIWGEEKHVTLKRVEEFGGTGEWRQFGLYILVERFAVKRMDGSLILTYDFKHTEQTRSKWE